jgi:CBS domain-containing protein
MKKCNEVMTKDPICCLPNDLVIMAAQLMKSEHVGSIPVIENEQTKKLVGIVTVGSALVSSTRWVLSPSKCTISST